MIEGLKHLINNATDQSDLSEVRANQFVNIVSLGSAIVCLIGASFHAFAGYITISSILVIPFLICSVTYIMNQLELFKAAKIALLLGANLNVFSCVIFFPSYLSIEINYLLLVMIPFLIINRNHKAKLATFTTLPFALMLTHMMIEVDSIPKLDVPQVSRVPEILNNVFVFISCILGMSFLNDLVGENYAKLQKDQDTTHERERFIILGNLAASIAHEISTPLMVIGGYIETLSNDDFHPREFKKQARKWLPLINNNVDEIRKIILEMEALIGHKEKNPQQFVDIVPIVRKSVGSVESTDTTKTTIHTKLPNTCFLKCRPTQIRQLCTILLNNSIDAIERLDKKWIEVNLVEDLEAIHLSIIDSGCGIPSDIVEKIMNPFYTTKNTGKGTGLGLSLASLISEDHGGYLYYDKSSDHTKFTISFPKEVLEESA